MAEVDSSATSSGEPTGESGGDGSSAFLINEGPPGAEATETGAASQAAADSGESGQGQAGATPASPFFEFETASGEKKVFSTQDEAKQFFSSWNGRLSKSEREFREAERLNLEWQRAYESGQLAEHYAKNAKAPAASSKTAGKSVSEQVADHPVAELLSKVDKNYVADLLKKGESVKALEYMTYVNGLHFQEKLDAYKAELMESIDSIQAPSRFREEVSNSLQYVAESEHQSVTDSGEPRYPEFVDGPQYDKGLVQHFRKVWLDMDVQQACTPTGFRLAYHEAKATYRRPVDATPGPTAANQAAAAELVRDATGRFVKQRQALAMSSEGNKSKPQMGTPSRGQDVLTAMRNAAKPVNRHFGGIVPE